MTDQYQVDVARLSKEEQSLIDQLAAVYNEFIKLPGKHPSDDREFEHGVHVLQRHVMARLARRIHPELFRPAPPFKAPRRTR